MIMNVEVIKKQFILDQIWILTVQASFQRASVYKGYKNKEARKLALRAQIEEIAKQYVNPVSEEVHIQNIWRLCCIDELGLNINFGVAQKLLNLYLKYLWTLGYITPIPPHFPVDRMIQEALKYKGLFNWTGLVCECNYKLLIKFAKAEMSKRNLNNLAEMELVAYNEWVNKLKR